MPPKAKKQTTAKTSKVKPKPPEASPEERKLRFKAAGLLDLWAAHVIALVAGREST